MAKRVYDKLRAHHCFETTSETEDPSSHINLYSANASQMDVVAKVDTQISIKGLKIATTFHVIADLVHDLILGETFLRDTEAIIDMGDNALILYRGLIKVPLTKATNSTVVRTVANITIPPWSQAMIPVKATHKLK